MSPQQEHMNINEYETTPTIFHVHPNRYVFMKYFVEVFSEALVVLYHFIPSRLNSLLPRVQASISFENSYLFFICFSFFKSVC